MYIPKHNEETRPEKLRELMAAHPLATLVTMGASGLFATHLPLVWEAGEGEHGVLRGHIARTNVQWREFDPKVEALAIFSGPDHYIKPGWYPEKEEDGRVVPTWNYAVVHAYGALRIVEDGEWLMGLLQRLTAVHEAGSAAPWTMGDAPEEYIGGLLKRIVGVEIPITRIEGKWKLDQKESVRSREGVVAGLERLGSPESLKMKELMEETVLPDGPAARGAITS